MSIAVSAIVKPSRTLSHFLIGMAFLLTLITIAAASGWLGEFLGYGRYLMSIINLLIAITLLRLRPKKTVQIDISGTGQIRLREITDKTSLPSQAEYTLYTIDKDATLWPNLLFLHLRPTEKGKKEVICLFRDSVTQDEFRALYVACRWIVAHGGEGGAR